MRIWIDGYEANVPQRLGSSQVAFELLRSLEKIDKKNDYTILLPAPPLGDMPAGEAGLPKERTGWKYKILKPKRFWTRLALPFALYTAKQKPEIFFSPTHYIPRFIQGKIKRIVTIFDLSFLHFPEMFARNDLWQLQNWTKFSAKNADHVITISKFSKDDISKKYNLNKEKITVAYPGYDREKFKMQSVKCEVEEVRRKYGIGESYIIYIGTIQPRKNLIRLIEAFGNAIHLEGAGVLRNKAHLRGEWERSRNELELVVVGKTEGEGKQGWMYEDILKAPERLGIAEKVKFLGFVPTEDLPLLLYGAIVFVQPSLWEGFGIPVIEAMAVGTPAIISNVSSLPEVAGKAGFMVDPYSIDQIEQAIRLVVTDKKLRQKYSKAGILQAKKFSWDKMARVVLNVFEKTVS